MEMTPGVLSLPTEIRGQARQSADDDQRADDADQAEKPGNADPERGPLHPPVSRRGHQVDEEEERQNERPLHEEAECM